MNTESKPLRWIEQHATLNYRIGDIQVGSIEVPVRTPVNYFWELEGTVNLESLVAEPGRGILLRSLPVGDALPRIATRRGAIQYSPKSYWRFLADLNLTAEKYLSGMSGKSRSTLKRKVRKFEESFGPGIDFREYRSEQDVGPYFDAARQVSSVTYQERLLGFGLPDSPEFIAGTQASAREGNWRGYVLFARATPIAYVHCPLINGVAIYAYVGFNPKYADASPGTVLQWLFMQRMFVDPAIQWFDFTEGEGPHKEFFSTHKWRCADVWLLRPTLWNWLLILTHAALDAVGVAVGRVLERVNLKRLLRLLLRRQ